MSSAIAPVIVWFRQDLRLDDNPALSAALKGDRPVIPVFIREEIDGPWTWGGASRWWLHHSLAALGEDLRALGSALVLRRGDPARELTRMVDETGAAEIHWNLRHEPHAAARDDELKNGLEERGVAVHAHRGSLLADPEEIKTGQGGPYQVYTPYWKRFSKVKLIEAPLTAPEHIPSAGQHAEGLEPARLGLRPRIRWDAGLEESWEPGEAGAQRLLKRFSGEALAEYGARRDLPAVRGSSLLSPHLHWGEISPRRIWHQVHGQPGADDFLRQLVWREFAHQLLHHFPETPTEPLRPEFEHFPWDGDPKLLPAWQEGKTGYPLVDAGMRQLWHSGWMHNRVRMVVASFLVKHLLLPWQEGARWFWDTLVDADLANNTFGWQWTAGCGADAAPYFRIFNPVAQGKKFDKDGEYIRRWVPELAQVPAPLIHEPWRAKPGLLEQAGVTLGQDYPQPIVDHDFARQRALDSYQRMRSAR